MEEALVGRRSPRPCRARGSVRLGGALGPCPCRSRTPAGLRSSSSSREGGEVRWPGSLRAMSWRPRRASAKSSQSSRFAQRDGAVGRRRAWLRAGLAGGRFGQGELLRGLAEEGVHLPDRGEDRVRVDRGRLRLRTASAGGVACVHLVRAVEQARLVDWPEPEGAPGVHDGLQPPVRGARASSGRRRSRRGGSPPDGLRQILRAPDVDGAADLAFGDAQALDDQGPQVLGAAGQGLQALDLGELVADGLLGRGGLADAACASRRAASPGPGRAASPPSPPRPRPSPRPGAGSGGRGRTGSCPPRTGGPRARSSATPPWPAACAGYRRRPAPIRELPRTRCRPNQGACRPRCMTLSQIETSASSTAVSLRSTP